MIEKYDEAKAMARYKAIEDKIATAVKLALSQGAQFWSTDFREGIGLCDAYEAAFNGQPYPADSWELDIGISYGFYDLANVLAGSRAMHADFKAGRRIGERLRKLLP